MKHISKNLLNYLLMYIRGAINGKAGKAAALLKFSGTITQGLLEFIWTEGYSGRSSNPGQDFLSYVQ